MNRFNKTVRKFLDIVYCQLTGGHFGPCGPQIDFGVRLREVSAYRRLKM